MKHSFSWRNWILPTPANNYRATLISNAALAFYVLMLLLMNVFSGTIGIEKASALLDESTVTALHNKERAKIGLGELKYNETLASSAKAKGEAMLAHDCWSHYCPEGKSPWDFFRTVDYDYAFAGENLAEGFSDEHSVMQAWMNSQTHKENILKPEFTEIGIALIHGDYQGIRNNTIVVVHFGKPKSKPAFLQTTDQSDSIRQQPSDTINIEGVEDDEKLNGTEVTAKTETPNETQTDTTQSAQPLGDNTNTVPLSGQFQTNDFFTSLFRQITRYSNIQIFTLILVLTLCIMFVIDIIMIKRYQLKHHTKIRSRSHLHLSALLIMIFLIIISTNLTGVV